MKPRNSILAGAALLLLAAPALAGQSSRAEREATRQLNLQAAEAAQPAQPQVAVNDAGAAMPANSPPAAAPTAPVQSSALRFADATPQAQTASGPIALSSLVNPPSKIATANVLDSGGQTVGAVQKVEISAGGNPIRVVVALIGKKEQTVVLDAGAVSYDPDSNQITAQATGDQIKAMAKG